MSEPLMVSVCIATYQHAPYIGQAIDSVLMQQTDFPIQICIGEDGSTDGTREICQEYAAKHPNVIHLFIRDRSDPARQKYHIPFMHNFVETLKACNGKYIAMLEGDDYWTDPKKLQKQMDFLEKNLNYSICFHPIEIVNQCKEPNEIDHPVTKPPEHMTSNITDLVRRNYIYTPSVMIRNINSIINFDFLLPMPIGDWPMWLMVAKHGDICMLPKKMAVYRIHKGGTFSQKSQEKMRRAGEECLWHMIGLFENKVDEIVRKKYKTVAWKLFDEALFQDDFKSVKSYLSRLSVAAPQSIANRYFKLLVRYLRFRKSKTFRFLKIFRSCSKIGD